MVNQVLDWSLFGSYWTDLAGGASVDTGGMSVSVAFNDQNGGSQIRTASTSQYTEAGEPFDANSGLKLYGTGGDGGNEDTSTTVIDFSAADESGFSDEVKDVTFRINDLDVGTACDPHIDIVTIRAYDTAGNEVPVLITAAGTQIVDGNTVTGSGDHKYPNQEDGSVLIDIAGPVSRVEIDYDNGSTTDQAIWLTDVHFETVPAVAPDGIVEGTSGNDHIDFDYLGDPDGDRIDHGDAILPGEGPNDDIVLAGDGNDTVYAAEGNDEIHGGNGNDNLHGGEGDDEIFGDAGNDNLNGGDGKDRLFGGDGNDELRGDHGDDFISTGSGNNVGFGGEGNDTFEGGSGRDVLFGGDGRDTFTKVGPGDVIDGNEGGDDFDTLDLRGGGPFNIRYTSQDFEDGFVDYLDEDGDVTGTLRFRNIENIVPCFTPGTLIATPKGECLVEDLKVGDRIITRDNGIQEIRWYGVKSLDWKTLRNNEHLKPILIKAGALGHGLPERDMLVSPNHRMLVANDKTSLYFDEREVLASAKHLINNRRVHRVETLGTTYIHFMFDQHEVVLANGSWTESFQPGDYALKGIGNAQRQEIFDLFPDLKESEGIKNYHTARRVLKKHEAQLLRY